MTITIIRGIPHIITPEARIELTTDGQQRPQDQFPKRFLDADGRLTCPGCGCHDFRVPDSEKWQNGAKRRYRACRNCGIRVRTREVVDE